MTNSITKYLTRDIVGAASKFLYGRKGQDVTIIYENGEMCLVERGPRFWVRKEYLSKEPVKEKE